MLEIGIYYAGRGITLAVVLAMFIVFLEYIRSPILSATFVLPGGSYDQSALCLPPFFTGDGALIMLISNLSLSVFGISIVSYLAQLIPTAKPWTTCPPPRSWPRSSVKGIFSMKVIDTKNAPSAIGPYYQGYAAAGLGITAQAEWSCHNVGAILTAVGTGFDKVTKTTCFLADMGGFASFNEVYAKFFVSKPARSCAAVKTLPKGALCEIGAIAVQ